MTLSLRRIVVACLAAASFGVSANQAPLHAQPKVPVTVAPQMPTINTPSPNGAQRGTSIEVTLTGSNLADPISVSTSFPAKTSIPTDMNNGKDAAKLRVKIDVPADAPIGFHTIRVATKRGISNARLFCIDDLPQVAEVDTNRNKSTAQPITVPCVVMGKADPEISDYYKFTAKPGQRLTFEVIGRRLGSAFDPMIVIHDAKTGRDMPGLFNLDAPGLQSDPRLTHTFKDGGEFIIEVRDTTFAGGADYFYRLRIGDFPAAISAIPVEMKRGAKATVNFAGPSVEGVAPVEVTAPTDPAKSVIYVTPKGPSGLSGWPLPIALTDTDEIAETEPNNEIAKANRLNVPGGATGRFLTQHDVDYFVFTAKKGTKYSITAETFEINSSAQVFLTLKQMKNGKEEQLKKSAPEAPTPKIEHTATEDGDLYISAEHLNFAHGPTEVYHLTVKTAEPDVVVNLLLDRFDVVPGATTLVPVHSVIRRDYAGPIVLTVAGHPGFSGTVTIPAGTPPAAPPPQPGQVVAWLPLTAKADVPMGSYELRVEAKGTVAGKDFVRLANITDVVRTSMANLGYPPKEILTVVGVGVTDKPLFALAAKAPPKEAVRGVATKIAIAATRAPGFADEIAITAINLPANVTVAVKPIGKGANDIEVLLTAAPNAALGTFSIHLRGTTKSAGKDYAYFASTFDLAVVSPFELKAEPSLVSLKPGAKAKVKVTATRKAGFAAAIDLELKNLPANVTAPKTPIPMGKNDVEIELTAAPTAAAADKVDVNVTGTAAGNVMASPNFTVRVEKVEPKKKEEPKKTEPKKTEPKKEEPKKTEPKKEEKKKTEAKKEEPKKTEPKKEEPKKTEPKKEEPKKK